MAKERIAKELVKLAKELTAGGIGAFSGDAADVMEAIVMQNKRKSMSALIRLVKADDFIAEEIEEMNISDREIKKAIESALMMAQYYKGSTKQAAAPLWAKVASQFGEKLATRMHSDMLKQAAKYSDDDRLNPTGEMWVQNFLPVMLNGAIHKLQKLSRKASSKTAATARKRGVVVLDKDDFRRTDMWDFILDTFDIPHGEEADFNDPETIELSVSKAEYH